MKLRSSGTSVYERLHEEAKMSKIVLENRKREFEQKELAEFTFMPKVGIDIDDGMGSVTSGGSTRIDKLAEPKAVNDKRFNVEHSKLQESKRRPSGLGTSGRGSGPETFREKKQQEKNDTVADKIVKGMVVGGEMGAAEWGENEINDNPFTFEELNDGTPKTVQTKVAGEMEEPKPNVGATNPAQEQAQASPIPHVDSLLSKTPITLNPTIFDTPQKDTPITDISADSNMTPPEEKKTKKELQDEFEVWQREMEQKLGGSNRD